MFKKLRNIRVQVACISTLWQNYTEGQNIAKRESEWRFLKVLSPRNFSVNFVNCISNESNFNKIKSIFTCSIILYWPASLVSLIRFIIISLSFYIVKQYCLMTSTLSPNFFLQGTEDSLYLRVFANDTAHAADILRIHDDADGDDVWRLAGCGTCPWSWSWLRELHHFEGANASDNSRSSEIPRRLLLMTSCFESDVCFLLEIYVMKIHRSSHNETKNIVSQRCITCSVVRIFLRRLLYVDLNVDQSFVLDTLVWMKDKLYTYYT